MCDCASCDSTQSVKVWPRSNGQVQQFKLRDLFPPEKYPSEKLARMDKVYRAHWQHCGAAFHRKPQPLGGNARTWGTCAPYPRPSAEVARFIKASYAWATPISADIPRAHFRKPRSPLSRLAQFYRQGATA